MVFHFFKLKTLKKTFFYVDGFSEFCACFFFFRERRLLFLGGSDSWLFLREGEVRGERGGKRN